MTMVDVHNLVAFAVDKVSAELQQDYPDKPHRMLSLVASEIGSTYTSELRELLFNPSPRTRWPWYEWSWWQRRIYKRAILLNMEVLRLAIDARAAHLRATDPDAQDILTRSILLHNTNRRMAIVLMSYAPLIDLYT